MGKLIFEEGDAIATGTCLKCAWSLEIIFEIGDDDRDMAYSELEELHASNGCMCEIEFQERSHKFEEL